MTRDEIRLLQTEVADLCRAAGRPDLLKIVEMAVIDLSPNYSYFQEATVLAAGGVHQIVVSMHRVKEPEYLIGCWCWELRHRTGGDPPLRSKIVGVTGVQNSTGAYRIELEKPFARQFYEAGTIAIG